MLYLIQSGNAERWTGQPISGVTYPSTIRTWTGPELLAVGLVDVHEVAPPDAPAGKVAIRDDGPSEADGVWAFRWTVRDITPEEREAARQGVSVTKRVLALGLLRHEILTSADAILVPRGQWPIVLVPYVNTLPPEQAAYAEIEFAGSNEIERMHPTTQLFQAFFEISDAVADDIFGISVADGLA